VNSLEFYTSRELAQETIARYVRSNFADLTPAIVQPRPQGPAISQRPAIFKSKSRGHTGRFVAFAAICPDRPFWISSEHKMLHATHSRAQHQRCPEKMASDRVATDSRYMLTYNCPSRFISTRFISEFTLSRYVNGIINDDILYGDLSLANFFRCKLDFNDCEDSQARLRKTRVWRIILIIIIISDYLFLRPCYEIKRAMELCEINVCVDADTVSNYLFVLIIAKSFKNPPILSLNNRNRASKKLCGIP